MTMKRREFLARSIAGLGAVALGSPLLRAAEKAVAPLYWDPYEQKIPLGKTGIKMSRLCLGTGMRGGGRQSNHTRLGKEKFEALIRYAYEHGVRVFDLADLYGTHPYVIPALKNIPRKNYTIISKIWFRDGGLGDISERPGAEAVVSRFLKEMNTDYIDLLLLHCVTSGKWNQELSSYMNDMAKLKQKGAIRAVGVSCHSLEALKTAAAEPWVDSVHTRINAYGTKMDGKVEDVVPVIRQIHDAGKGVVGMKLIGEGEFRNDDEKKDKSIHFVMDLGKVDILNVGFEKPEEIDDFAKRLARTPRKAAV
ncbi:MAG: aldo/keto reductase [Sedimentisphaerales bacterium]|nr:aldo/keto reductase [Sedimentisphaerales bacterium]